MTEQTTMTETTPDEQPPDPEAYEGIPENGEVQSTEIIDASFDDKRRVKETSYRVIADGEHITYIEDGDILVRDPNGTPVTDTIEAIGPNISSSDGMHVHLAKDDPSPHLNPIHLNLIRKWIENGDAVIYGTRQSKHSEVKGVDY